MKTSPIIEISELVALFRNPDIRIFDVRTGQNARSNYEAEHLAGAFFVDLETQLADIKDDFADGGRHPLPDTSAFARTLTDLGITKDDHIVVYDDQNGSNAAARFWWMLVAAGHKKVQVLNGGLQHARRHHFPMHSGAESIKRIGVPYKIDRWQLPLASMTAVQAASENPDYLIVDVRSKARYEGISEPIDLVAGHIPGAINIPFTENMDDEGLFLHPNTLKERYETRFEHINASNVIVHCGSGVTACHTILALAHAGMAFPNLYIGSWSEWSRNH